MKQKTYRIAKIIAVGIFFIALFMNIHISLTSPFLNISNDVFANSSSSSDHPIPCERKCESDPTGTCKFLTYDIGGSQIMRECLYAKKK